MMSFKNAAMLAGICIFATLLFPPFHTTISVMGATQNAGYGFILSPPVDEARVDIAVLLVQWLGISLISGLLASMPPLASLTNAAKRRLKISRVRTEAQEKERSAPIDYGPTVRKILIPIVRLGIFILVAAGAAGCVLLAGRFIVYELLEIAPDDFSRPAAAFEIVVIPLLTIILFRKIVLKKSVKAQAVGLGFYLSCMAIAVLLVGINQADAAPVFEWLGIAGMAAYFVIRPFKRSAALI